ncbi:Rpn family recombination-promoting nuclease/putative transposase [Paenibacillus hamazuiensis]|uniref:Rpn family recombination-promoting nuclease/putative transposase n=1 Tax=Paenibacillus hamazuiensis TaxID=2936508 RepID=UPI00200E13E5|nr:Rpn family recombination-promoting nuclease/putative transposase [Paenibacillus hamazuiensis]
MPQDQEHAAGFHRHDRGYKYLLSSKQIFLQLLKSFVHRDWVQQVDESRLVGVDKSYILPDFSKKEADIVYRLQLEDQDIIFYVLLEMQSTVDYQMPYRLLMYQTEIWRDVLKNTPKPIPARKDFRLPAIVPLVVYSGKRRWTASRSFREVIGGEKLFGTELMNFQYILIDVQRYKEEDLLSLSNTIGAVFLLQQQDGLDDLRRQLSNLMGTVERMPEPQLRRFLTWLTHRFARKLPHAKLDQVVLETIETFVIKEPFTCETTLTKSLMKSKRRDIGKALN